MIFFALCVASIVLVLSTSKQSDTFTNKIPCQKWFGDIDKSPSNICKDCGYPKDCHGPYVGESWRHIFIDEPI